MREKRMIAGSISISRKINKLSGEEALFYTWLILHLDDESRIQADPDGLKARVCPLRRFSPQKIASTCLKFADSGLILYYSVQGDKYLELLNNKQTYHGIQRQPSNIPRFNPNNPDHKWLGSVNQGWLIGQPDLALSEVKLSKKDFSYLESSQDKEKDKTSYPDKDKIPDNPTPQPNLDYIKEFVMSSPSSGESFDAWKARKYPDKL